MKIILFIVLLVCFVYAQSNSASSSRSHSNTPSISRSASHSNTPSISKSASYSNTPSVSRSASYSTTPSISRSASYSTSPSISKSASASPSVSKSPSSSSSPSISETSSISSSVSKSASYSNTPSISKSSSASPSVSKSSSSSSSPSISETSSISPSVSRSASYSNTPSISKSASVSPSVSKSLSSSSSPSASPSNIPSASPNASATYCDTEQYYGLFITNNVFGDDDCVSCFLIGNIGSDVGYYCDDGIYVDNIRVGDDIIESSSRGSYSFNSTNLAASYEFNGEYHSIVIIQENIFTFGWTCSIQESILECETFNSENQQVQTIEPPLLSQSGIDFTSLYELNNEEFGNFILDVDNNLLFIDNSNETVRILVEQVDCCKNNDCIAPNLTCDTNICVPTEDVAGVWEFICAYVSLC